MSGKNNSRMDFFAGTTDVPAPAEQRKATADSPQSSAYTHTHEYAYTDTDKETRSKRVYFLIKPSANQQLDEMVKRGEIVSKNDLVNKLIDDFLLQRNG